MSEKATVRGAKVPLSDSIMSAVCRLLDDQGEWREPSHSAIQACIQRAGLLEYDPRARGDQVGKVKRVRAVLSWAIEHDESAGADLVALIIAELRGCGGFRPESSNYIGAERIDNARSAFRTEGYVLGEDGDIRPVLLDALSDREVPEALTAIVRRARRGSMDAALVTGTGKDLLEATAAYVLVQTYGEYAERANFPTLLGQAFEAVGLATPQRPRENGEHPRAHVERSLYELGCAVNRLRNKEGTGHGRPFLPTVRPEEARRACETMGVISDLLLEALSTAS